MTAPLMSACVVVTDEVHDLHACLAALQKLRPLLSDIHVYGVAASERVLDFARKAGATVATGEGEHDVSAARNNAAAMAKSTWVLVVEPGEKIVADLERLQRLLVVEPGMMAQPDALSIQVRTTSDERDRSGSRQVRVYRPEVAKFDGMVDPRLVPVAEGRKLTILTPGREVISVSAASAERDPVIERARLERRIERANTAVADLEKSGVGGDDLVTALVDRARLLREIDEDNAALADLTRARTTRATQKYRWRARQELATLLIKHGHYGGAETVIAELDRDGADEAYSQWLRVLLSASQGKAREALEVLRELGEVKAADGRAVSTPAILNERMVMAARVGEFDEALDCCIQLVAVHGHASRYARMLLKLWGGRSAEGLADRLVAAGGLHQNTLAEALRQLGEPGAAVADSLLDESREVKPLAVRVM